MSDKYRVKWTIQREMFLLSFLMLTILSLMLTSIFLNQLFDNNMLAASNSLEECNSKLVTYAEGMFHENRTVLKLLARDETILNGAEGDTSDVLDIYELVVRNNDNITYAYSGYENGKLIIDNYDVPDVFDSRERPWYQAAVRSEDVTSLVYKDAVSGEWLFSQCMRLLDKQGYLRGVVSLDCSNEMISRQLSIRYQYKSQRSFILNSAGEVIIHPDGKMINVPMTEYLERKQWNDIFQGSSNYAEYVLRDTKYIAYFERIPNTNYIAATSIDRAEITRPIIKSIVYFFCVTVCISVILGIVLSKLMTYRFARPIMALGTRIQNIALGIPDEAQELNFSNREINRIKESIECIVEDIARREKLQKTAEYMSYHDSMTGIYNRRYFDEVMKRMDEQDSYPLCIICCDINGLKLVNDVFGHSVGDQLICRVAECLKKSCRDTDVLVRMGGDEFIIIMPDASEKDVKRIIPRIQEEFYHESICGAVVSISTGYSVKKNGDDDLAECLWVADKMMYEEKIVKSAEMKRKTVQNIIQTARKEGLILPLTLEERQLLEKISARFCPASSELLKKGYLLRNIGLCSLFFSTGYSEEEIRKCHTEISYRVLSSGEEYLSVAESVLHYTEHWDGSGEPAGLAGENIPLCSRIIAVVDEYSRCGYKKMALQEHASWFAPEVMKVAVDEDG